MYKYIYIFVVCIVIIYIDVCIYIKKRQINTESQCPRSKDKHFTGEVLRMLICQCQDLNISCSPKMDCIQLPQKIRGTFSITLVIGTDFKKLNIKTQNKGLNMHILMFARHS